MHDILAYQDTIRAVEKRLQPDTIMISVSDHETGGVTLGLQLNHTYPIYKWNPEAVLHVQNSSIVIADYLLSHQLSQNHAFINQTVMQQWLGILPTALEMDYFQAGRSSADLDYYLAKLISDRALIGWTTHGIYTLSTS